ncbi:MAG TPA: extensin family protein, partial [Polyangiaceae bacterium]
ELWARWNAFRGDEYELDSVERWMPEGERATCDRSALVSYPGTTIRYQGAVLVRPAFKERLARFESVVAEAAREIYGREPRRLRHYGAFSCRSTRNRSRLLSEHALGNALDVVGFDFGPATKATPLSPGLPPALKQSFQVRVARHWAAEAGTSATHARFLRLVTERLRERDDIFRSMFGPGHGGHDDHLHLDVSPWRYVDL